MGRMNAEWYKEQAKAKYENPRVDFTTPAVEIDPVAEPNTGTGPSRVHVACPPHSPVSNGTAPGAWVMMWVWIPDPAETKDAEGNTGQSGS